jgi:hypothetical protein
MFKEIRLPTLTEGRVNGSAVRRELSIVLVVHDGRGVVADLEIVFLLNCQHYFCKK